MKIRWFAIALLSLPLFACSGPKVEVEGGGKHPFPGWIVKLDQKTIKEKKTGTAKFSYEEPDVLEDRFIHSAITGFDVEQSHESLVKTYESSLEKYAVLLDFEEEGTDEYKKTQAEIEDIETKLIEARAELEKAKEVSYQNSFIDCKNGWRLKIQLLKGGKYHREAQQDDDPDNLRKLCAIAKINPEF